MKKREGPPRVSRFGAETRTAGRLFLTGAKCALVAAEARERVVDRAFDLVRCPVDGLVERLGVV